MKFLLTPAQAKNLHDALIAKRKCTLTLSSSRQSPSGVEIPLGAKQIRLLSDGRPHKITIHDKTGGLFPLLIPILAGLLGAGVAATTIGKNVYDMAKGRGVGGFLPLPLLSTLGPMVAPIIGDAILRNMQQSGKGMKETVAEIFLSPTFLNHLATTIGKHQGSGLRLGTSRGRGMRIGPPRNLY